MKPSLYTKVRPLADIKRTNAELKVSNDNISLVVSEQGAIKGDALVSAINLQPDSIKIASKNINIVGAVTFDSFESTTKTRIEGTETTVSGWKVTGKTTIDGGKIETDSISVAALKAGTISADKITISSTTSGVVFNSSGIVATKGDISVRMNSGVGFDIRKGAETVFSVDSNGFIYAKGMAIRSDLEKYVQSRGENLVTNGTGLLGNNTNFSYATFDASDSYYSNGSFTFVGEWDGPETDELIPVNVDNTYRFKYYAKANPFVANGKIYGYVSSYDADGLSIAPSHTMYHQGTTTTLAQTLSPGATSVVLTSAANWKNSGDTYDRSFIFWNYVNAGGYVWPKETYSRNYYSNWWNAGGVNTSTNTITLNKAWTGPTIPAGTWVSNGSSGGALKYIAGNYSAMTAEWQKFEGTMGTVDLSGQNDYSKFHPGTASVKLGWLCNVNTPTAKTWLSNISFQIDYAGDIKELKDDMVEVKLDVSADSITSKVTSHTTYINDVNSKVNTGISNIRIGGRNLLLNTEFKTKTDEETQVETVEHWTASNLLRKVDDFKGMTSLEFSRTGYVSGGRVFLTADANKLTKTQGVKFTVSTWFYIDGSVPLAAGGNNIYVRLYDSGGVLTDFELVNFTSMATNTWHFASKTFELTKNYADNAGNVFGVGISENGKIKIAMPKLEEGTIRTEWSPAPEDFSQNIDTLISEIQTAKQAIKEDSIVGTVLRSTGFLDTMAGKADASSLSNYTTADQVAEIEKQLKLYADGKIKEIDLSSYVSLTQFNQTANNFDFKLTRAGGVNLLQNSVGWANDFYWITGGSTSLEVIKGTSELIGLGAGAAWKLNGKSIEQSVPVVSGEDYTFQMLVKKKATEPGGYVDVDEGDGTLAEKLVYLTSKDYEWAAFTYSFTAKGSNIRVRIRGTGTSPTLITNVMLNKGPLPMQWTHAKNEIHNSNVRFDLGGIVVQNSATNGETRITPEEFAGYATNELGEQEKIFTLNGDTTEVKKLKASEQFSMGLIRILQVEDGTTKGWAFLPNE